MSLDDMTSVQLSDWMEAKMLECGWVPPMTDAETFAAIRATISRWANTGRIQPPVGDFWGSDLDKMTQEIVAAITAGKTGET